MLNLVVILGSLTNRTAGHLVGRDIGVIAEGPGHRKQCVLRIVLVLALFFLAAGVVGVRIQGPAEREKRRLGPIIPRAIGLLAAGDIGGLWVEGPAQREKRRLGGVIWGHGPVSPEFSVAEYRATWRRDKREIHTKDGGKPPG